MISEFSTTSNYAASLTKRRNEVRLAATESGWG